MAWLQFNSKDNGKKMKQTTTRAMLKRVQTLKHFSAAMAKQGELTRSPLTAPLLRLCTVGLLTAAPALSSRAAVDSLVSHGPGHWLGMRTLLQVHLPLSVSISLSPHNSTDKERQAAAHARELACPFYR